MSKLLDHNQHEFDTARIKNYFVLVFILGSLFIILGLFFKGSTSLIATLVIPLLLMFLYLYIGLRRSTLTSVSEQFADSCYYLGFLFTLVALSVSLWDFRKGDYSPEGLVARFGLALATTIVGLTIRIYIVNFREGLEDAKKIIEAKLTEQVEKFSGILETTTEKMQLFNKEYVVRLNKSIEHLDRFIMLTDSKYETFNKKYFKNLDNINQSLDELYTNLNAKMTEVVNLTTNEIDLMTKKSLKRLSDNLDKYLDKLFNSINYFIKKTDDIILPPDLFVEKLQEPTDNLIESINTFTNKINNVSITPDIFSSKIETPINSLIGMIDQLKENISNTTLPNDIFISQLQKPVSNLTENINKITAEINNINIPIDYLTSKLDQPINNLINKLNEFNNNIKQIFSDQVPSMSELSNTNQLLIDTNNSFITLKGSLDNLNKFILVDNFTSISNDVNNQINNIISSMKNLDKSIKNVNTNSISITDQFKKDLKIINDYKEGIRIELDHAKSNLATMYHQLIEAANFINDKLEIH